MPKEVDFAGLQQEARLFREQFQTVILSTSAADGSPDASYAPYVLDETETPYIFVSGLAQHTRNLLSQASLSLLFIADEKAARNPFARQRLTLQCHATEIPRNSDTGIEVLNKFQETFGKTAELLQSLGDFHLLRLNVTGGSYVKGFGQAYQVADSSLKILHHKQS